MEKKKNLINKIIMITMFIALSVYTLLGTPTKISAKELNPTGGTYDEDYSDYQVLTELDYYFIESIELGIKFNDELVTTNSQVIRSNNILNMYNVDPYYTNGVTYSSHDNVLSITGRTNAETYITLSANMKNLYVANKTYSFYSSYAYNSNSFNISINFDYGNGNVEFLTPGNSYTVKSGLVSSVMALWIPNNIRYNNVVAQFTLVQSNVVPTQFIPKYTCGSDTFQYNLNFNGKLKTVIKNVDLIHNLTTNKCMVNFNNVFPVEENIITITDKNEIKAIWKKIYDTSQYSSSDVNNYYRLFLLFFPNMSDLVNDDLLKYNISIKINFKEKLELKVNKFLINTNGNDLQLLDNIKFDNDIFNILKGPSSLTAVWQFNILEPLIFNTIELNITDSYVSSVVGTWGIINLNFFYSSTNIGSGVGSNNSYKLTCEGFWDIKCNLYNTFMGAISDIPILGPLYDTTTNFVKLVGVFIDVIVETKEVAFFGTLIIGGIAFHVIKEMKE